MRAWGSPAAGVERRSVVPTIFARTVKFGIVSSAASTSYVENAQNAEEN